MMGIAALLAAGIAVAAIGLIVLWSSPRAALVAWVTAAFFIPVWVGITVGILWSALTVITVLALILHARSLRWTMADLAMVTFMLLSVVLWATGTVKLSYLVIAVLEWSLPYAWGRVVLDRIPPQFIINAFAIAATIAATLAIIESLTGTNWFIMIPGSGGEHAIWGTLQYRGGLIRVEGAMGHSIALGAVLAMSSAFVIATSWMVPLRICALALLGMGTVLTLSRIGLLTFVLTVAICVLLIKELSLRNRLIILGFLGAAVLIAVPFLTDTFSQASDEFDLSAQYRSDLTTLLGQVQIFGAAPDWESLVVGDNYLGFFVESIDSTVVLTLLRYGIVPSAFAACVVIAAIWSAARKAGTWSPAAVAVAAQIPSLFVVALITQFGSIFWFVTGLSVAWSTHSASHQNQVPSDASEESSAQTVRP